MIQPFFNNLPAYNWAMIGRILTFLFIIQYSDVFARIIPSEGDTLNYIIACFSVPKDRDVSKYIFTIAEGNYTTIDEFSKHVIIKTKPGSNTQVVELPAFGKVYTWAVTYRDKANKLHQPVQLNHFRTGYDLRVDTNLYRLRIIKTADVHSDAYIMPDKIGVIYNMQGSPVWYLPYADQSVTDLKQTSTGTFTYIDKDGAYEIDYNGNKVWEAPNEGKVNGESTERYHDQLTKLNNGNYMIMGNEIVLRPMSDSYIPADSLQDKFIYKDGRWFCKVESGVLIEYDAHGNVIWSWKASSEYTEDTYFGRTYWQDVLRESTGMNAFYFDEKNKTIYISFSKLNNIVKIQYPDGQLLAVYGKPGNAERQKISAKLFYNQHDIKLTGKGTIYLYNNNTFGLNKMSTINAWREYNNPSQGLQKIWEYSCILDDSSTFIRSEYGGTIYVFSDSTVFAATGSASRMFLINPGKELAWDAIPEKRDKNTWIPVPYDKVGVIGKKNDFIKSVSQRSIIQN